MPFELLVLRLLHVLGGIFWVGAGVYSAFFVMPALSKAGPSTGAIMAEFQRRKLTTVMFWVSMITLFSGLRLLWIVSGGFALSYFRTGPGHGFAIGGALAIVASLVGLFYARPMFEKMGKLGAAIGAASDAEKPALQAQMEVLRKRGAIAQSTAMLGLIGAAVMMSVARYL